MESIVLNAVPRAERGKANNRLRREGSVPAVVYGHNQEPLSVLLDRKTFDRVYVQAGENTIVTLNVEGTGEIKTLIKEVSRDPVSDAAAHVDFLKINLKEKLETAIPIDVLGESPAVKNFGGILVHNLTELKVRCLPTDLVHSFQVDISGLAEFGDMIVVSQVKVPSTIEVLEEPETPVLSIAAPKAEEPEAAPAPAPDEVPTTEQKAEGEAEGGEKKE